MERHSSAFWLLYQTTWRILNLWTPSLKFISLDRPCVLFQVFVLFCFFRTPRASWATSGGGMLPYSINMLNFWTVRWIIFPTKALIDLSALEFIVLYLFIFPDLSSSHYLHCLRCKKEVFCYPHLKEHLSSIFFVCLFSLLLCML